MKKYVICGLLLAAGVATWERADRVRAQADVNPANGPEPVAGLMLVESKRVGGQENPNPPVKETVARKYDIRDLLFMPSDYPLSGNFVPLPGLDPGAAAQTQQNGSGQSLFQGTAQQQIGQERANRVDEIKKFITDNVEPTSWKDNGGDVGSISSSPLRAVLMVTTTAENQKAVQAILEDLRRSTRMVHIRADWLMLAPGQIEKLQKNGPNDNAVLTEISRDLIRALPETTVHFTGSIACYDGQTVHIASGRAKTLVTNVTPVVAPEAVAMDPTISMIHEGIALQVAPTLVGDSAILDLYSIFSEPNKAVNVPSTQPSMPTLDHINSMLQDLRTTVRVPLGKPVLIGGSTTDPNPDLPGGKQMYLVIQVDAEK